MILLVLSSRQLLCQEQVYQGTCLVSHYKFVQRFFGFLNLFLFLFVFVFLLVSLFYNFIHNEYYPVIQQKGQVIEP